MRRFLAIISVTALFCLWLIPVTMHAVDIRGGVKAGLNIASIRGADVEAEEVFDMPADSKLGFVGGVFVVFNLSTNIAIQAEALYSSKGAQASIPGDWEITASADYLEIPILAKYIITTKGSVKPFFFAGPALALKLASKVKAVDDGMTYEGDLEGIKSTDVGIAIGGGLEIGKNLTADIRYTLGLTKVIEIEGVVYDVKNGALSVMIGYCF
jgi:opacity protein-like surface antigen